ncbi:beta-hexosaminidase subunit beta-like [Mytilus edulis]|uniref:beta-hexosaminidase subunit beta-like n=1 Tax=Mytilus edulis TaxID=6550 RepID=UPI0039EF6CFD
MSYRTHKMVSNVNTGVFFLLVKFVICSSRNLHATINPTIGAPWPMPQKYTPTGNVYQIEPSSFRFEATGETCDILTSAFDRYKQIIFGTTLKFQPYHGSHNGNALTSASVKVKSECAKFPSLESDESYDLVVSASGITINANEVWGALRGLETFSQIIVRRSLQYFINGTTVTDFPRFQHRGMLIDTSRHFLSVDVIKEHIEAMAQNKFNVLHWHIVDDPSFPYTSAAFPEMSQKGSYPGAGHIYTASNVLDIIGFARMRGIRVIPEFDTPGHTQSWGKGIPDLLTKCYSKGVFDGSYGPVDPSKNTTYTFLETFFGDVANTFPDQYIHLGGDEVSFGCWQSNPDIKTFMSKMSFGTSYSKLEQYYMQSLLNIIGKKLNKGYLIWQEVIDNGAMVQPDTVVEVWKGGYVEELAKVTKLGYKTLLSSCWYLNYISYGDDWRKYYACDPQQFNGTDAQKKLIIGGETCMWGEFVDNTNLIARFWPRAAAVGERLWSDMSVKNTAEAAPRLEEHRCRMVSRGFAAEPVNGPGYCPEEYTKF